MLPARLPGNQRFGGAGIRRASEAPRLREDGIYFDHRDYCRDSAHHKNCSGRWRGVISGLGRGREADPQELSGQTKAAVKDKLEALHSELDAGIRTTG
jgi:hypothetical protein